MDVGIRNINAWVRKTESAKKRIKSKAGVYVRAKATAVITDILRVSPQWSGNFVYNWSIATSQYGGHTYSKRYKVEPYWDLRGNEKRAGDPEAIAAAMAWNRSIIESIKWNTKIGVVNTHPLADEIQSRQIPRPRPENLVTGGASIVSYISSKYKFIV